MLTRRQLLALAGATAASSILPATAAPKPDVADLIKALEAGYSPAPPIQPAPLRIHPIDLTGASPAVHAVAANRIKSTLFQFNRVLPKQPLTQARIERVWAKCVEDFQYPVRLWVGPKTLSDYNRRVFTTQQIVYSGAVEDVYEVQRSSHLRKHWSSEGSLELKAAAPGQFDWRSQVALILDVADGRTRRAVDFIDNPNGQPIAVSDTFAEDVFAMEMADGTIRHFPEEAGQPVVRTTLPMVYFNRIVQGSPDRHFAETARIFGDLVDRGVIGYGALCPPSWLELSCPDCIQAMEEKLVAGLRSLADPRRDQWRVKTTIQAKMVLPDEKTQKLPVPGLQPCPHGGYRGVFFYAPYRVEWYERKFGKEIANWPSTPELNAALDAEIGTGEQYFHHEGALGGVWKL